MVMMLESLMFMTHLEGTPIVFDQIIYLAVPNLYCNR